MYRHDPSVQVMAFTAAQIPHIDDRRYPRELAGPLYPDGIPIHPQSELESLVRALAIDEVVFAYSDVSQIEVMRVAEQCLALGPKFSLPGPADTMLQASVPVIAVSAVRTGCGKSPLSRWLGTWLRQQGLRVAVIRHPMPYGDLRLQQVLAHYPKLGPVLPALGYSNEDLGQLAATIAATPCDVVAVGTPIDLARLVMVHQPVVRVRYQFEEAQPGALVTHLQRFLANVTSQRATVSSAQAPSAQQKDHKERT
jgi:predicted GTPase